MPILWIVNLWTTVTACVAKIMWAPQGPEWQDAENLQTPDAGPAAVFHEPSRRASARGGLDAVGDVVGDAVARLGEVTGRVEPAGFVATAPALVPW